MNIALKIPIIKAILAIMVTAFTITGCDKMPLSPDGKKTVFATVAADSRFQILTAAINRAGLAETLKNKEASLTLFAPTDQAFANAGFKTIQDVANTPVDNLKKILLYHVLGYEIKAGSLAQFQGGLNTLGGEFVKISGQTNPLVVFVNDVKVTQADLFSCNGVVHVIDQVLPQQKQK